MDLFQKIPTEIIYVFVAAFGGIARYLQHYLNDGTFYWMHFFAHIFVSMFSGYMFFHFATDIAGMPETTVAIFAGLGGWLGVEALKMMESFVKDKFVVKKKDE